MQKTWMRIVWPAFLGACTLEFLVFAFFDPFDLRWFGHNPGLAIEGIYTLAFLTFWAVSAGISWLSYTLGLKSEELNRP